jgi:hypothetical protein
MYRPKFLTGALAGALFTAPVIAIFYLAEQLVGLQRILAEAQPLPNATHLRIRSVDDFHETLALDEIRAEPRIMLTYAWDGLPLPAEHGDRQERQPAATWRVSAPHPEARPASIATSIFRHLPCRNRATLRTHRVI